MKKRVCLLGLIALIVALAVSIQLNIQLYREAADNYRDLNGVRLDPLGLSVYAAANQQSLPAERPVVVIIGDSRAAEWTAPTMSNFTFVNRGIGAQTTAQVLGRFAPDVAPVTPDIAVIQVGINDLKALPLFPERACVYRPEHQRQYYEVSSAFAGCWCSTSGGDDHFPFG